MVFYLRRRVWAFSRCWAVLLCLGICTSVQADDPVSQIRLASEQWNNYTEADGRGMAWDILREVFEPAGVAVQISSVPYKRSVRMVQRGEVDAWVGACREEPRKVHYPRWNYDTDHIYALGLATDPVPSLATLGRYRLVWVRGYKYQNYLPNIHHFNEVQRRADVLSMLLLDRADYYIDALTEVDYVLSQVADPALFKRTHLVELPLFLGFADTPRGHTLSALFDRRMDELVKKGRLRPIFQRWHQPYPFESGVAPASQ